MGIVRTTQSRRFQLEEFCQSLQTTKLTSYNYNKREQHPTWREIHENFDHEKLVCVTSGVSYLGLAIVNRLLNRGYSVRIAVDNQEELEKLREMNFNRVSAVTAKMTDVNSLFEAFNGCRGVFHTSAFIDPAGVSGYTKYLGELEMKASENVMKACAMTDSVRKCVFTSSLLACIWRNDAPQDFPNVVDHNSWTEESICIDKKLWFALGKTMAEKAAWRIAEESDVRLVTICPGLITGPEFYRKSPTPSTAYMKGAQDMYRMGLLATVDVSRVAEAHICVYEAMNSTACGRYLCFDRVIEREVEVVDIATQMGLQTQRIASTALNELTPRIKLCNEKLSRLMSRQSRCY
ncbi:hypothetical protein GIB67_004321 [Kingdonia uniflora]|uniref:3-beta hydroxysteroid dehydrogenase/isomerase domain-containing protein n=1 Tax=Kingdonia uniflora TaxID=39325 RepID=A0A7J7MR70_9MAGN|nr:hypothetical protein GIB67_004321 [Kingdonia uniflora]